MKEEWKDIKGYEGLYQISNLGRIKSFHNYRKYNILKYKIKDGYYSIGLRKNGIRKWKRVHRLIAEAFIPNPNNYPVVNHKDENKLNNSIDNLEWCSITYNNTYGTRIQRVIEKTSKPVNQYDLEGNFIKQFPSISEAARQMNTTPGHISQCVNGNYKTSCGYIWKYKRVGDANAY